MFEQLQIKGLIGKVIEGYHATVFAYGQTGSGKTYTMEGYKYEEAKGEERAGKVNTTANQDVGLSVRAIREIFKQAEECKTRTVQIYASFLQIYNEKVFDLLNSQTIKGPAAVKLQKTGLKIRWSKSEQFIVENLFQFRCNDADHAI